LIQKGSRSLLKTAFLPVLKTHNTSTRKKASNRLDSAQLELIPFPARAQAQAKVVNDFISDLDSFREFGQPTRQISTQFNWGTGQLVSVPTFVNEFWTARQRQASSLHEVSYRACFKPQLPRFFIERLTQPGEVVYDPFMGRGTTPVEAALLGRVPFSNDINPLSLTLTRT